MAMEEQRTSEEGLKMLANFEGTVLQIYHDVAGVPTIGTGHALTRAEKAMGAYAKGITRQEAATLLRADVAHAEEGVRTYITVALEQHQFDALVSFTFNLGVGALAGSTLRVRLNAGDYASVPHELVRWDKRYDVQSGHLIEDPGLLKRRQAEAAVWTNGYGHPESVAAAERATALAVAAQFSTRELLDGKPDPDEQA